MDGFEKVEARRQQAHRRLSELEIAARIVGEQHMAWHITQAARSGASFAEVLVAVKLGVEMRGTLAAALKRCAYEVQNGSSSSETHPGLSGKRSSNCCAHTGSTVTEDAHELAVLPVCRAAFPSRRNSKGGVIQVEAGKCSG